MTRVWLVDFLVPNTDEKKPLRKMRFFNRLNRVRIFELIIPSIKDP